MFRDRVQEALDKAAPPILAAIRRDRERAKSYVLKTFLRVIEERLFDSDFEVQALWDEAGTTNQNLWRDFKDLTGKTPKEYVDTYRLDAAKSMLQRTDLQVQKIGEKVGYGDKTTFARVFRRYNEGQRPSEFRWASRQPKSGRALLEMVTYGGLDLETHLPFFREAAARNPGLEASLFEYAREHQPEKVEVVDGTGDDRRKAEELWREIRDLPPKDQRRRVRGKLFTSTAFFDLLRKQSRLEGRRDRQRGIEVAELLPVCLEASDEVFGDRIHDLRALAWAWLANAHRLASEFLAADAAFKRSDLEWRQLRSSRDQRVLATICRLKGMLRTFQRRFDEAFKLVERSRKLCEALGDRKGQIKALMQQATIHTYAGQPSRAIEPLETAAELIPGQNEPLLLIGVPLNLANAFARIGDLESSSKRLLEAKAEYEKSDYAFGCYEIQSVDAFLQLQLGSYEGAESSYLSARLGFVEAGDLFRVALTCLDLAIVYSEKRQWTDALEMAAKAVPTLQPLRLYSETVQGVRLLAEAVEKKQLSLELLRDVKKRLELDPLLELGQEAGAENPGPD